MLNPEDNLLHCQTDSSGSYSPQAAVVNAVGIIVYICPTTTLNKNKSIGYAWRTIVFQGVHLE